MRQLIGREHELREVADRLRTRRLVTVFGPAGVGKTAVARAVADQLGPEFELGAHHVDLTRTDESDAVHGAIADQLGFSSFDALVTSPSDQPALVVVDNCEHVIDAVAEAVSTLLASCDAPTVLATSRSPLGVPDESLVALGPLRLPAPGHPDMGSDAVRLFVERVRDGGGNVDSDQIDAVAELCRQLDGLPLALELAAARVRVMQPAEILVRLADGVEVLDRPRFRGDERHRSLGATIEWSCRLLPDDVAATLHRLGLVAGPFPAALAHAVAADVGIEPERAPDALALLVDSSLVSIDVAADTTRYRVLETVRSYAVQRLRDDGLLDIARQQLADHVVRAAIGVLDAGAASWDRSTFTRLYALYDPMASTVRWCLAHDDRPTRAMLLCSALWGVVHQSHTEEIAALADAVLDRWPDPALRFASDTAATAATARYLLGDLDGATDLAERALPWSDHALAAPVTLRRAMGYAATARGDDDRALAAFEEVAALARDRGLLAMALEADVVRAQLTAAPDLVAARALAAAAEREAVAAGSIVNEVWAQTVGARLAARVDVATAMPLIVEALTAARRIDFPAAMAAGLRTLAWASTTLGDHRTAATALLELYDRILARAGVADLRGALTSTADLLATAGDDAWATLLATAVSLPSGGLAGFEPRPLVPGPPPSGTVVLSRRDSVTLARDALRRIAAADPAEPSGADAGSERRGHGDRRAAQARFEVRGDLVHIEYGGRQLDAPVTKGLTDIARLLSAPGRDIHSVDLVGGAVDQASTGEVIDRIARRQYEERIRELQDELADADANHDIARSERLGTELDLLVEHLASSLGLGGRPRSTAGTAERARSAVTQRIRGTIRRLRDDHPELARHLDASVRTGAYCSYHPENPVDWQL